MLFNEAGIIKYNDAFQKMVKKIYGRTPVKCRSKQPLAEFKKNTEFILDFFGQKVDSSFLDEFYSFYYPSNARGSTQARGKTKGKVQTRGKIKGKVQTRGKTKGKVQTRGKTQAKGKTRGKIKGKTQRIYSQRGGTGRDNIKKKLGEYGKGVRVLSFALVLSIFGVLFAWTFFEIPIVDTRYNSLIEFLTNLGFVGTPVCGYDNKSEVNPFDRLIHDMVSRESMSCGIRSRNFKIRMAVLTGIAVAAVTKVVYHIGSGYGVTLGETPGVMINPAAMVPLLQLVILDTFSDVFCEEPSSGTEHSSGTEQTTGRSTTVMSPKDKPAADITTLMAGIRDGFGEDGPTPAQLQQLQDMIQAIQTGQSVSQGSMPQASPVQPVRASPVRSSRGRSSSGSSSSGRSSQAAAETSSEEEQKQLGNQKKKSDKKGR
jgi:hypothetical protein